ncbi:hypothetical protein STANM309S_03582 [Streptomyces tanashiensis]
MSDGSAGSAAASGAAADGAPWKARTPAARAASSATAHSGPPLTMPTAPLCSRTYRTSSATSSACTGTTVAPAASAP